MAFAHDTEAGLSAAAALVNTLGPPDGLADLPALAAFVAAEGWTGRLRADDEELAGVRALRPVLRGLWSGDEDQVVALVNRLLREGRALPQLVRHDDWGYHVHATSDDAPLEIRMAVEAATAVADLVRAGELSRLRTCARPDCADVLVDLTRNRSRRFCDETCANREHVAAYRARSAASRPG
ncbi:RNA-binding protein [Modestobacter sp. I12A-02628]|uniref:CGNR zinc finger domain-containing protein n=1 Tax=Goekera deserti TaxID=2497753 RepID=A0A7K3WBL3_9ACTN|nr:CGNR zinc finger domain-containing protein [Goekera deserti]MPQ98884.1 RNA-binding protein [Goekera deserti]NDI49617.1 RNA-binding protein [Goekera deserti]NEL53190.1 CGNR zinc finger domain-containing protein [Goekera deserti]